MGEQRTGQDAVAGANSGPFDQYSAEDVRDLIREFPLAWVCGRSGGAEAASLLPLVGEFDDEDRLTFLVGHLARVNPLYAALRADPRALILFTGPQAYVSPGDIGDRAWAPTWNYAQLRVEAEIAFEPASTHEALEVLVRAMEQGRDAPWRVAELGGRYAEMVTRIIGFRARVTKQLGRFKLGQDERAEIGARMIDHSPDSAMRRWLARFAGRRHD